MKPKKVIVVEVVENGHRKVKTFSTIIKAHEYISEKTKSFWSLATYRGSIARYQSNTYAESDLDGNKLNINTWKTIIQ